MSKTEYNLAPELPEDIWAKATEWLKQFEAGLSEYVAKGLPEAHVYDLDGCTHFEWQLGPNDISLNVLMPSMKGYYHGLNHETDETEEVHLDFSQPSHWRLLYGLIGRYALSAQERV